MAYRLRPSGAPRWVHCAGSVTLEAQFPETESSEAAREGTASHWVAEENMRAPSVQCLSFVGRTAPNGVIITEEMAEAALTYTADALCGVGYLDLRLEAPVAIPRIHASECGGTTDCWAFNPATNTLHVWDYKYGWGLVEAYENWQVLCYVIGLVDMLIARGVAEASITVDIRIVQPRPYHEDGPVRSWKLSAVELRPYANTLHNAAAAALEPNPETRTGEHCRNCEARHACPTAHRAAMAAMDIIGAAVPHEMSPAAVGSELTILRIAKAAVESRLTGMEAQAVGLIKSGKGIPDWAVKIGKGLKKWAKPIGEVLALGDLFGHNLRKPEAAITPRQAEKLGIPADVITAYSTVPETGLKLIADNGNKAKQIFKT